MRLAVLLLLCGCATQPEVWVKAGAGSPEFNMDAGQCKAQAFSVPNAPLMQVAIIYNSCMQGKGWHLERR